MSTFPVQRVTTHDGIDDTLKRYHRHLEQHHDFPYLSPNKAMHGFAQALGLKNGHVLRDSLEKHHSATTHSQPQVWLLSHAVRPYFEGFLEPITELFTDRDTAIRALYTDIVAPRISDWAQPGSPQWHTVIDLLCEMTDEHPLDGLSQSHRENLVAVNPNPDEVRAMIAELCTWASVEVLEDLCDAYFDEESGKADKEAFYHLNQQPVRGPAAA